MYKRQIQHQGIGERIYQRDADLFANAAKQGLRVSYQSSGEPRATESGENFKLGFDQASNGLLANAVVAPNNPADNNSGKNFDKNTTTLYFHKTDNPDGTQKTGEAKELSLIHIFGLIPSALICLMWCSPCRAKSTMISASVSYTHLDVYKRQV